MRISDLSSDVCSSDLCTSPHEGRRPSNSLPADRSPPCARTARPIVQKKGFPSYNLSTFRRPMFDALSELNDGRHIDARDRHQDPDRFRPADRSLSARSSTGLEIGTWSWRERVLQEAYH